MPFSAMVNRDGKKVAPPVTVPPSQIQRYTAPLAPFQQAPVGAGDGVTPLRDFTALDGPVSMEMPAPVMGPPVPQEVAMEPLALPVSPELGGRTPVAEGQFAPVFDDIAGNNMDPTPDKNRGVFGKIGRGLQAIAPLIGAGLQGAQAGSRESNALAGAGAGFTQTAFTTPMDLMRMQQQQEKHDKDLERADIDIEKGRQGVETEKARTAQIQTQTGLMGPQFEESQLTSQARRKAMEIDGRYREQLIRIKDQEIENFKNLAPYQLEQAKARLAYERARAQSLKDTDPLTRRKLEAEIARLEQSGELDRYRAETERANAGAYQTSAQAAMMRAKQGPSQGDPLKTALAYMQARDRALAAVMDSMGTDKQIAAEQERIKAQYDPVIKQYMQGGASRPGAPGGGVDPSSINQRMRGGASPYYTPSR